MADWKDVQEGDFIVICAPEKPRIKLRGTVVKVTRRRVSLKDGMFIWFVPKTDTLLSHRKAVKNG